jgi:hypothetical protein
VLTSDAPTSPLPVVLPLVSLSAHLGPDDDPLSAPWADPDDRPPAGQWIDPSLLPRQRVAPAEEMDEDDPLGYGHVLEDQWPIHGPFTRDAAASAACTIRYLVNYLVAAGSGGALESAPDAYPVLWGLQGALHGVEELLTTLERFMWAQSENPAVIDNRIGFDGDDTAQEIAELLAKCRDSLPWFRVPISIATESASHLRCALIGDA